MNASTNQPVTSAPGGESQAQEPVVPIWLIIVLFMLAYWGAVYFDEHGGWFDQQIYAPYRNSEQLASYNAAFGPQDPRIRGAQFYGKTCVACHQASGLGQPGQYPPLAGSDFVNEKDPGRMIRIVLQGFGGPGLSVNGKPFTTGAQMTAWNSFPDEDIAAVISYVRANPEWGNHASIVTPEQVRAIRDKVKAHPMVFSPGEIMSISPSD